MSKDNNVNLNIKTTADTKGAEQIEDRLKRLKAETDELTKSTDKLGDAGGDEGSPSSPQVDPEIKDQMSQMLRIQYASMARDIGQGISSIAKALHDTAQASAVADPALSATLKNTATGLDSLSLGLTGAAQGFAVGGPLGGAIGGLVGLMAGPLKTAFNDYQDALIKAGEAEEAAIASKERLKRTIAEVAVQTKEHNLEDFYRRELNAIEDVISAIERRAKVESAQRSAATAKREADQTEANRDPNRSFADRTVADVSGDFADQKATIEANLKKLIDNAAALSEKASDAFGEASAVAGIHAEGSDAHRAAIQKAQELQQAADQAQLDVEGAIEEAKAKLSAVTEGFRTRLGDATEEVQEKAADDAQAIVDKIVSSGAELNSTQQLAKQNLEKIYEDGKVTAGEQTGTQQALAALIGNWKTDTQTMMKTLAEANKLTSELAAGLNKIQEGQNAIRQQISQIR